jgi:hypothetical protein
MSSLRVPFKFIPNRFLRDRRELEETKIRQNLGQVLANAEVNSTHSDITLELPLQIIPSHLSPQGSLDDFFVQLLGIFDHFFFKDFRAAAAKGRRDIQLVKPTLRPTSGYCFS